MSQPFSNLVLIANREDIIKVCEEYVSSLETENITTQIYNNEDDARQWIVE